MDNAPAHGTSTEAEAAATRRLISATITLGLAGFMLLMAYLVIMPLTGGTLHLPMFRSG